ncbi:MAG: hypothetical protein C5B58_06825 [Acidobacteria bacterium]|nr:MAG: hypothetical protein C5B58_06825 [Acidobacteriota bacterium]
MRSLVVDDEPDVDVFFRRQFRRGWPLHHGICAIRSHGARTIADAHDRLLILILLDINMPGMSGLELLPTAKAARPGVPIITITKCWRMASRRC